MATFTTLFCATEAELSEMFPSWHVPRTRAGKRTGKNPFTGEPMQFVSWLPASVERVECLADSMPRAKKGARALPPVLPPDGEHRDYQQMMEKRAPAALRAVPHAAMKAILGFHLEALATALGAQVDGRPARVAPDETCIDCLSDDTVAKLAALEESKLGELSIDWANETGDDLDHDSALWALRRLHALARLADGTKRKVCVFVEI